MKKLCHEAVMKFRKRHALVTGALFSWREGDRRSAVEERFGRISEMNHNPPFRQKSFFCA